MKPRASNVYAARGLAYERKVAKELTRLAGALGGSFEHNPWFEYKPGEAWAWHCVVPDGILTVGNCAFVIEVKLTYVPEAVEKLAKTYVPVVRAGLCAVPGIKVFSLVIARSLSPEALNQQHISRVAQVTDTSKTPVLQWLGHGQILW